MRGSCSGGYEAQALFVSVFGGLPSVGVHQASSSMSHLLQSGSSPATAAAAAWLSYRLMLCPVLCCCCDIVLVQDKIGEPVYLAGNSLGRRRSVCYALHNDGTWDGTSAVGLQMQPPSSLCLRHLFH